MNIAGLASRSPRVDSLSNAIRARGGRRASRWAGSAVLVLALTLSACGGGSGPANCFNSSSTTGNCLRKQFTDDPVEPNNTVTLEFTLSHYQNASANATGITFSDDLNAVLPGLAAIGLPIFNVCGIGSQLSGTTNLTFTGGSLAPGQSCSFSATLQVPPGASAGTHTNTTSKVTATVAGQAATANPATDDLAILGLGFAKSFTDDPVLPGGTANLQFTITNTNLVFAATSIVFSDDLDAALAGLAATGLPMSNVCGAGSQLTGTSLLSFTGGALAAGASCTFSVTLQIPAGVPLGTTATNTTSSLTGEIDGAAVSSDPASDDLLIGSPNPPGFTKSFAPSSIATGAVSTLSFTIDNTTTPMAVGALDFTDNLPAGVTVAAPSNASTTCTGGTLTAVAGGGVITYTGGTVAASASCTISVDVTSGAAGTFLNTTGDLTSAFGSSGTASATLQVLP